MTADRAVPDEDCVLCPPLRFRLNTIAGLPGRDAVLAEDDAFFLMPDLAPLAEGHLLLVAAAHLPCAGAFGPDLWDRAVAWRGMVARLFQRAYGDTGLLVLEHGPASPQGGGACVDHFHWHLLPGVTGVRAVLARDGLDGVPAGHALLRERQQTGRSYLLVEESGTATVHPGEGVPGQYLRHAAATAMRAPGPWRWQEVFATDASRARFHDTLDTLRAAVEDTDQAA
ncbi:HIT family protein [Actinomadura rupiterrae]|uniref:HIT family protein n=1 Tax=Actinomadura rupiterrae TaxID=559627 RepID=UPI0020A54090|nr:HIT domain-containing protein [Actinomadura rupiterrae]MCP2340839.1 diadenosine tetraphosphate (Ap4A) HIT family hydrolase [Actinomadura rupiterrae]